MKKQLTKKELSVINGGLDYKQIVENRIDVLLRQGRKDYDVIVFIATAEAYTRCLSGGKLPLLSKEDLDISAYAKDYLDKKLASKGA